MNKTMQKAMESDEKLNILAAYYESEGMTKKIKSVDQVMNRFVEFKRRLLNRGITMEQLENMVFEKWGGV